MNDLICLNKKNNGAAEIIFNREEACNAFNEIFIKEFDKILHELKEDPAVRLLTIEGKGKFFSAGADINWMKKMKSYSEEENYQDSKALAQMLETLATFPSPTIAVVNGPAFGGGVGLIACCDMAIADEENAKFAFSEAKLGLVPAVISPYIIKAIGARKAQKLFLTAETFGSKFARDIGLIDEICPKDRLHELSLSYQTQLLNCGPNALKEIKEIIVLHGKTPDIDIHDLMVERIASIRVSNEAQEGLSAFLEKRKPKW